MMGLDHHSCPLVSLMILRCVPIWKQRAVVVIQVPRNQIKPGNIQEREGEVAAKRWLFKREKSKGNWRTRSWANRVFTVLNQLRAPPA